MSYLRKWYGEAIDVKTEFRVANVEIRVLSWRGLGSLGDSRGTALKVSLFDDWSKIFGFGLLPLGIGSMVVLHYYKRFSKFSNGVQIFLAPRFRSIRLLVLVTTIKEQITLA